MHGSSRPVTRRPVAGAIAILSVVLAGGCREQDASAPTERAPDQPLGATVTDPPFPSPAWVRVGQDDVAVAVADEADPEMKEAIDRARATARPARQRWAGEPQGSPTGWAIKWAAPTRDGGREYVWVVPLRWTAHRIEGRLASEPRAPLACERGRGGLVGFGTDELVDWVRLPVTEGAPREGGFTIEVLEARFGAPPAG